MAELLLIKERLRLIYGRYEIFITPVLKFILALITYLVINKKLGYMENLANPVLAVMMALVNTFLPVNIIILFAAAIICLHLYRLSLIAAAIAVLFFIILFLIFLRFSSDSAIAVIFAPLAFVCHVPYVLPICLGLVSNPLSALSTACGTAVYFFLSYMIANESAIQNPGDIQLADQVRSMISGIVSDRTALVYIITFAVTILVVYIIRRLSINYAWYIAIAAGAIFEIITMLFAGAALNVKISVPSVLLGVLLAIIIALILQFFLFSVDYTRTEYVQFEDEEYYYHVKAVPKLMVSATDKQVKRINRARVHSHDRD